MIDLNSSSQLSNRINKFIDKALVERNKSENISRDYLGGSRLGVECERQLQFEYFHTPKDEGKDFTGRTLRIFRRGFWIEDMVAEWLNSAGFDLRSHENGEQFGFKILDDKIAGHCDGIFLNGPDDYQYPCLWENKGTGAKSFNAVKKHGLKKAKPEYYSQIQFYQKHFKLTEHPALFSIVNMDNMKIHWELVEHDSQYADMLEAKGIRIIQACEAGELLPRQFHSKDYYVCKWCSWCKRCYAL